MIVFNIDIGCIVPTKCVLLLSLETKHHVATYLAKHLLISCEFEDAER